MSQSLIDGMGSVRISDIIILRRLQNASVRVGSIVLCNVNWKRFVSRVKYEPRSKIEDLNRFFLSAQK